MPWSNNMGTESEVYDYLDLLEESTISTPSAPKVIRPVKGVVLSERQNQQHLESQNKQILLKKECLYFELENTKKPLSPSKQPVGFNVVDIKHDKQSVIGGGKGINHVRFWKWDLLIEEATRRCNIPSISDWWRLECSKLKKTRCAQKMNKQEKVAYSCEASWKTEMIFFFLFSFRFPTTIRRWRRRRRRWRLEFWWGSFVCFPLCCFFTLYPGSALDYSWGFCNLKRHAMEKPITFFVKKTRR